MAIPKLRFKDFGEDWTAKKLSQVANLTSSKRVHLSDYVSEGIPFFRGKEITELKSGIFPKDILYISKKQYENFKEKFGAPQNNEILMTAVGTLANTYLINTDFEFYFKDGNLIWFKDINADPNFLMILLDARKNDVLASAIGSTQKALTIANLNKLIFNFPSNEEQIKITSFLSAADEKISQLTQKHALLSQYKQGMMQKLFSQQIRFKADDGSDFGEWEETKFLDLMVDLWDYRGKTPKKLGMDWGEGEIQSLSALNIKKGFIDFDADCHLGSEELYKIWMNKGDLEKDDIIFTMEAPLGNVALIPDDRKYILSQRVVCFKTNKKLVDNKFLFQLILSDQFQNRIEELATGTTAKGINQKSMQKIEIALPPKDEQTKIANFLSAIDQKIEVVAQQIEQAKHWKKGLLQQMFV